MTAVITNPPSTIAASGGATLHIPPGINAMGTLEAALAYAAAGWYVGPVKRRSKDAGSVLGPGWPARTTRDPRVIASWFTGTDRGMFLHAGRSGAVVLDVDDPDKLPAPIVQAIRQYEPPFQSTRDDQPGRGHHVFAQPAGRELGNSVGELGGGWGEVRGRNGVIIGAPSEHASGGHYQWHHSGHVPTLPGYLASRLPDAMDAATVATDGAVTAFLGQYGAGGTRPDLLDIHVASFRKKTAAGESRHHSMQGHLVGAMKEAAAGMLDAKLAADTLESTFLETVAQPPTGKQGPPRVGAAATTEWRGMLAWAVAQALAADPEVTRARTVAKVPPRVTEVANLADDIDAAATGEVIGRRSYIDDKVGLLAKSLLDDVRRMGPLAAGSDNRAWSYANGVWKPDGGRVITHRVVQLLGQQFRPSYAHTVEVMLLSEPPFITDEPVTQYINVANGLLDWRTGAVRSHTPDIPTTAQLPVRWNTDATCPNIDKFLLEVVDNTGVADLLAEVAGYACYGAQPLHKAILLLGEGRNGKGTFLRIMGRLIGESNIATVSPQDLDGNKFMLAELYGKLANLIGDVEPKTFKETAKFKSATGGDRLTGERKYAHPFGFINRALIVAAFNTIPKSADTTTGFFSRWIVVPFPHQYTDPEPNGTVTAGRRVIDQGLEQRLSTDAEMEGFLVAAVTGLRRLMDTGRFSKAAAVVQAERRFRIEADPVRDFLNQSVIAEQGAWVSRNWLHSQYGRYAEDGKLEQLAARPFLTRVREVHADMFGSEAQTVTHNGQRGWGGIRLRSDSDPDIDGGDR